MDTRLKKYVDFVFENAPRTKETLEFKEEMLQNLNEKYQDLLNDGKNEDAAYNIAVASIGDMGELIAQLNHKKDTGFTKEEIMRDKKRSAIVTSIAIAMYIMCVVPVIISEYMGNEMWGLVIMFSMVAIATIMLVYDNMIKIKNEKSEDTVVESFKEWKYENSENGKKVKAINSAIGSLTVVIYFLLSFTTGAWHITWIIFLIGSAVKQIIKLFFDVKR